MLQFHFLIFSKNVNFTEIAMQIIKRGKYLSKACQNKNVLSHSMDIAEILSHSFFAKKFRESNGLLKKLLNS